MYTQIVAVTLLVILIVGEITSTVDSDKAQRIVRYFYTIIVPLSLAFIMTILLRLMGLIN